MDSASDTRSVRSRFGPQSKAFVVSLNKKYSPYCLVQVGAGTDSSEISQSN